MMKTLFIKLLYRLRIKKNNTKKFVDEQNINFLFLIHNANIINLEIKIF
jgi:hypothetical protein